MVFRAAVAGYYSMQLLIALQKQAEVELAQPSTIPLQKFEFRFTGSPGVGWVWGGCVLLAWLLLS